MGDDTALAEQLRAILEQQPWFRKYSNTVTSVVGVVVSGLWVLLSIGVDVPDKVTVGVTLAISILTALGVYKTPNGITESQIEVVKRSGRHRRV